MKIILFATPEFSIPTLEKIYNSNHKILAVYTKIGKKQDRGMRIKNTPIYEKAKDLNLPVFTPKSLKKEEEIEKLKNFQADIFVVVAYGLILPKELLNITKYGCINIHPSLLPRWRGASPMQRTIMEGDKKTGVCIIQLTESIDDGDILTKKEYELTNKITLEKLHNDLSKIGAELMAETLDNIEKNKKIITVPQSKEGVIYADKIEKEEGEIDFNDSVEKIDCLIRALSTTIGTYFFYKDERIKIIKAELIKTNDYNNFNNGEIIDKNFTIKCSDGILKPILLQREGKKILKLSEFLKGFKI